MSRESLEIIAQYMQRKGIPYALGRWMGEPAGHDTYYFVGDYAELPTSSRTENGKTESRFILRGWTRGEWALLESAKARIASGIPWFMEIDEDTGLAVLWERALMVQTGDAELKSIEIDLKIKEWSVSI